MTEVLVFKTNINGKSDLHNIALWLQEEKRITQWNVDREDIDRVLRIVANELPPLAVVDLLNQAGYYCEELPD